MGDQLRRADIVTRREGAELLLLDLESGTAHCLSGETATVWEALEECHSTAAIASATGLDAVAVRDALAALTDLGLVVPARGVSRRAVARSAAIGGATIAAGVISIPLPAAARANSSTFTLTKVTCVNGLLSALLGKPLQFTVNLSAGRLTPGAVYTVTFSYNSAVLDVLGTGVITRSQTDSFTFTADSAGKIAGGAGATFTTSGPYLGNMSQVTVSATNEKNVFTASPTIPSC